MIGLALVVCTLVGALRIATLTLRATERVAARIGATLTSAHKRLARALRRKPATHKLGDRELLAMALQLAHEALKRSGQPIPTVATWRQPATSKEIVRS